MEPDRRNPAEREPLWFGGDTAAEPGRHEWRDRDERRLEDETYRVPEPRPTDTGGVAGPVGQQHTPGGPVGPRSGEPLPPLPAELAERESSGAPDQVPLPPSHDPTATRETPVVEPRYHAEAIDRSALRRGPGASAPVSSGIYRARRPAVGVLLGGFAVGLAVPVLLLLADSVGSPASVGGVIAGVLALAGLPLAALGMYGLGTGAARVPGTPPTHAWLRPPLAYLAVALVLFIAAGLAAS